MEIFKYLGLLTPPVDCSGKKGRKKMAEKWH
jgi:hypothetical protein